MIIFGHRGAPGYPPQGENTLSSFRKALSSGATGLEFDEMGTPYGWDGTTETAMTSAGTVKIACGTQLLTISIEPYTGEASVQ